MNNGFMPGHKLPDRKEYLEQKNKTIRKALVKQDLGGASKQKEIDWVLVIYLCGIQCTQQEIAGALGITGHHLSMRVVTDGHDGSWKEFYERHRASGKTSLRRAQWLKAIDGDSSMLKWLGQQYLNQVDSKHIINQDAPEPTQDKYDLEAMSDLELDALEKILEKHKKPEEGDIGI